MKWVCSVCGYVYEGAEPPEKCPVCGAPKAKFVKMDEERVYADEHRVGVARGLDQRIVDGLRMNFTGECSEVGMPIPCMLCRTKRATKANPAILCWSA